MADIFNEFSKNVSKTLKTVQAKSQTIVESGKIKKEISYFESKLNLLFSELGRMFYISSKKNEITKEKMEDLKGKCLEISKLEDKVLELKKELENLELKEKEKIYGRVVIGKCPNCGGVIYEGDKFCGSCGAPVNIEAPKEKTDKIICPNCGKEVPAGSKFCPECGFPFKSGDK